MKKSDTHLRRTKDLSEYTIAAVDTDIGTVDDFYFDDVQWTIRYIVVGMGVILPGRKVLISPMALRYPVWSPLHINVNLTWRQVESSPSIDLHKPVSRQHEAKHLRHFGWPIYWGGKGRWGRWKDPAKLAAKPNPTPKLDIKSVSREVHLRSTRALRGYRIEASDGKIGHLEDFLFDGETWEIRYVIVDTKNWWPGKKILLSPKWIDRVSWEDREICVQIPRDTIKKSPKWDPYQPVNKQYELRLHKHYGYAPDWTIEK
jgi:hypothetical protein